MTTDPFLNIGKGNNKILNSNQIVERKLHTIITFRIYPNGSMYVTDKQSWFDKTTTVVKKKIKEKVELKESRIQEEEIY